MAERRWTRLFRRRGAASAGLRGHLDLPPTLTSELTLLHGWVFADPRPVVAVIVMLDGAACPTSYGIERADVASVLGDVPERRFSGFTGTVDLSRFEGRTVEISVMAVLSDRSFVRFTRVSVPCEPPQPYLYPVGREVPFGTGFIEMSGAAILDEPVARIVMALDGRPVGHARLNAFVTPHLARVKRPSSLIAGFTHILDVRGCEPGTIHTVSAVAEGISGARAAPTTTELVIGGTEWGQEEESILVTSMPPSSPRVDRSLTTRVLVSTHHLGIGGAQLYLQELMRQLDVGGSFEFFVLCDTDGVLREELQERGVPVEILGLAPVNDPLAYEIYVRRISAVVDGFRPDVVLANTLQCFPTVDVAIRRGIPSVFVIHESFPLEEWFVASRGNFVMHPHVRDAAQAAMSGADRVVFEAEATAALFTELVDTDRSLLIRYGVETAPLLAYAEACDVTELRDSLSIGADDVVFICVGVFGPRKGQLVLATAFAEVLERHREAVLLLIGAEDDSYSEAVRRHVDDLGCSERIRILPIVRDLRPWYAMSDVLVSASDVESMPRSMMEAMAFGLPVLAADATGVGELVTDGESGWLVPTRDLVALRDGIISVMEAGRDRRREMGDVARAKVLADHTSDGYGRAFVELIDELTQN